MSNSARFPILFVAFLAIFSTCTHAARAQPGGGYTVTQAEAQAAARAAVSAGVRARAHQRGWPAADAVVVARSPSAFFSALEAWTPERRFPVLIDDGSARAAWRIAAFCRAFGPSRIEVIGAPNDGDWNAPPEREALVRAARGPGRRAAGAPGVVFAHEDDPAWPAAVLLAAGRAQPLTFLAEPGDGVSGRVSEDTAQALRQRTERAVDDLGLAWAGLGDAVDAITIAGNIPGVVGRRDEARAVTDVLGRRASGERWAWCGLVHGDAVDAAYRANAALFLGPERAWIFDGYAGGFGAGYDASAAAAPLADAGVEVVSSIGEGDAGGSGTALAWRLATRGGLDAGLILVNAKGHADWFDLARGRATVDDVPMLRRPAAVHFVHSFSAQRAGDGQTIAGRFFEEGAFAYAGSVHEPYLGAFVPHGDVASRMGAGMPWGAAVRRFAGPFVKPWKVQVFGDPLWGLSGLRVEDAGEGPMVAGARPVGELVRESASAGDPAGALRWLVMAGRGAEVRELGRALASAGEGVGGDVVRLAMPAAAAARDAALVADLFEASGAGVRDDPRVLSMVWGALRDELAADRGRYTGILLANPRGSSLREDARTLRPHVARVYGEEAVVRMYERFAGMAGDERTRERILGDAPLR